MDLSQCREDRDYLNKIIEEDLRALKADIEDVRIDTAHNLNLIQDNSANLKVCSLDCIDNF